MQTKKSINSQVNAEELKLAHEIQTLFNDVKKLKIENELLHGKRIKSRHALSVLSNFFSSIEINIANMKSQIAEYQRMMSFQQWLSKAFIVQENFTQTEIYRHVAGAQDSLQNNLLYSALVPFLGLTLRNKRKTATIQMKQFSESARLMNKYYKKNLEEISIILNSIDAAYGLIVQKKEVSGKAEHELKSEATQRAAVSIPLAGGRVAILKHRIGQLQLVKTKFTSANEELAAVVDNLEKTHAVYSAKHQEILRKNTEFESNLQKLKLNIEEQRSQSIDLIGVDALKQCFIDQLKEINEAMKYVGLLKYKYDRVKDCKSFLDQLMEKYALDTKYSAHLLDCKKKIDDFIVLIQQGELHLLFEAYQLLDDAICLLYEKKTKIENNLSPSEMVDERLSKLFKTMVDISHKNIKAMASYYEDEMPASAAATPNM